jgi:hypothetical protein
MYIHTHLAGVSAPSSRSYGSWRQQPGTSTCTTYVLYPPPLSALLVSMVSQQQTQPGTQQAHVGGLDTLCLSNSYHTCKQQQAMSAPATDATDTYMVCVVVHTRRCCSDRTHKYEVLLPKHAPCLVCTVLGVCCVQSRACHVRPQLQIRASRRKLDDQQ